MNGAILGMRKAEIDRKFDEIVAFSEIEEFLDTPVKRYSSGMYVRLAFAVAAHLEPEILIVDEVLAVGDFAFQKKCLGKMQEVASGDGRTILFVSHNMGALAQLCDRGILLQEGSVADERADPRRDRALIHAVDVRAPGGRGRGCRRRTTPPSPAPVPLGRHPPRRQQPRLGIRLRRVVRRPPRAAWKSGAPCPRPGRLYFDLYTIDGVRLLCSDVRDGDPAIVERLGAGRAHLRRPGSPARSWAPQDLPDEHRLLSARTRRGDRSPSVVLRVPRSTTR